MSQRSGWEQPAPRPFLHSRMQAQVHAGPFGWSHPAPAGLDHPKVPQTSREPGSCSSPALLPGAPKLSSVPPGPQWLSLQQLCAQQLRACRSQDRQLPPAMPHTPTIPARSRLRVFWPGPSIRGGRCSVQPSVSRWPPLSRRQARGVPFSQAAAGSRSLQITELTSSPCPLPPLDNAPNSAARLASRRALNTVLPG